MKVYVVTGFDLGWDNVVGVFRNISKEDLEKAFDPAAYYIAEYTVEETLT